MLMTYDKACAEPPICKIKNLRNWELHGLYIELISNSCSLKYQYQKTPQYRSYHVLYKHTCPSSSNAMTTTAAPYCLIFLALSIKSSSPSFRLMLFTMHFPWVHFSPASITAKFEESTHKGTYSKVLSLILVFNLNLTTWENHFICTHHIN